MFYSVKKVKPLADYKLLLEFENQEEKIFDVKPYMNRGIYKELINNKLFNSVSVSFDSIEWGNHAAIDPEFLYSKSVKC